jgi:hypothetical protein
MIRPNEHLVRIKTQNFEAIPIAIPDDKAKAFIATIKGVSYIEKIENRSAKNICEEHKQIVRERINKYGNCPESYLDWDDVERYITWD